MLSINENIWFKVSLLLKLLQRIELRHIHAKIL